MRCAGVDPSSSSTGLALFEDDELVEKLTIKPLGPKVADGKRLVDFHDQLLLWAVERRVEVAVVGALAMKRGWRTIRVLSLFEAASHMALERAGAMVFSVSDGQARNYVMGLNPNCSKIEAIRAVITRYPDIKWSRFDENGDGPGGDEIDAFVFGKAYRLASDRAR